ncbi:ABC transporter ATP-binding protein [Colwellia psychrerythraea]|uniref:ABC transporter, ATP-binding protein n=1 Tax=Colwellia psychrerythraea (strain 34H / ATCC BAA-681) TaxID=167879 RepID=Q47U45_COLP3|nr:ABC transporter ATP-binding protein [Colwellia psychrerythraea]AAZ25284.1 ABC transporter, ATP-binding protein [Colwellia psychrerythraea 34H]
MTTQVDIAGVNNKATVSQNTVIETTHLCREFGQGDTLVKALTDANITIERGEFTAIIGPSGSGKSTLLQLIGGLDNSSSGDVFLDNKNINRMTGTELSDFRRDHIGFIFQAYNLIPVLSARENIEYIMLLQGVPTAERNKRVDKLMHAVGLEGLGDRRPAELSGGQQQRVAVARAMVSKPSIILADEPTANLDSKTGADLLDMMKELNEKQNMTFVFSTHDPKIMERAKRIIRLVDGCIVDDERRS